MANHILPPRNYYAVFAALIALTGLTIGVSFIHLGEWHTIVGLTIAVCKALLVIFIFMHVWYSSRLTWLVILAALYWLGILIALTLTDYWTRWKMPF